jgi:hypothetical protein
MSKYFKHTHIQMTHSKQYVREICGYDGVLSSENVTSWSYVNCYQNCEISRVYRGVKDVFALLGCYTLCR